MNESPETLTLTKEQAEMQIRAILQEVALMGANDSEFGNFESIINGLNAGEIEPAEALEQANLIRSAKMDYH